MQLLRKLADHGQAILATIHQPSSELFQVFDRLLLLKKVRRRSLVSRFAMLIKLPLASGRTNGLLWRYRRQLANAHRLLWSSFRPQVR
jgi:hypothetical protein